MQNPISVPISRAADILRQLYLGEASEYRLHFSREQLHRIEDIFDIIIFTHGIRPVYFKYMISEQNPWSGSREQAIRIEKVTSAGLKKAS